MRLILFDLFYLITGIFDRLFYVAVVDIAFQCENGGAALMADIGALDVRKRFKRGFYTVFAVFAHHSFDVYRNFIAVCGL